MTKEELKKEWEKEFGKPHPEYGSIGRTAGCDDCDASVKYREEIKNWVLNQFDLYKKELEERIIKELKGIDKDEVEQDDGWWETSTGAEFGKKKLDKVISIINEK